jgi:hypothetical protein
LNTLIPLKRISFQRVIAQQTSETNAIKKHMHSGTREQKMSENSTGNNGPVVELTTGVCSSTFPAH